MKVNFRSVFLNIILAVGFLVILLSGLSLIHDVSYWYAKVLDFPRLQYLILSLLCIILILFLKWRWTSISVFVVLGLAGSIIIHSVKIGPYLVGQKKVPDVDNPHSEASSVRIMIGNVLITNRNADAFLQLIEEHDPDMVLAMEVDTWWVKQLQILDQEFPYRMEHPLDNAYGMALYSKLPLKNAKKRFLKHDDVPSFHANVVLPSGEQFAFHGIHPVAPFPSEKYPDNIGEREVALAKVGALVAKEQLPAIVAGDFNDVSWSKTTRFFEDRGDLRNVRLGRGLFNSFSADSFVMRWPLDHFFVSEEFQLKELEKLEDFGSDHFPMLAEFVLPKPE